VNLRTALISGLVAVPLAGCYGLYGHDEMERYAQRTDVITMSAGDAKEVNARTHMLTPWPPYVGDRRIPQDGARAVRAVECYRTATSPATGTGSTGSQSGGGAAAPFQVTVNAAPGAGGPSGAGQPKC
jgi:hypothetical protein